MNVKDTQNLSGLLRTWCTVDKMFIKWIVSAFSHIKYLELQMNLSTKQCPKDLQRLSADKPRMGTP